MPEENRVFDVTKPSRVNPSATSKPVIVGHQPTMSDPMVRDQNDLGSEPNHGGHQPTRIQINENPPLENEIMNQPPAEPTGLSFVGPASQPMDTPAAFSAPAEFNTLSSEPSPARPDREIPSTEPTPHIEELHFDKPKRPRKWPILVLLLLALLIAAYLAIDSGLINSNINLPVHFFKQPAAPSAATTPPAASTNAPAGPATPAGFNNYKITGTPIVFAAPASWGSPASTTEAGYSKRGGTNQSDGTYAYLVDFATNKDVEIAVTSSKYLPVARTAPLYYDYLQWCTGTNDGQIYESTLHFATADKIDTPTTITCDQGPVVGTSKLDSTTIVQTKAQDTAKKVIGDIYIKNLTDPALVVFRVKDAAMTNGDNIKQLLGTVQAASASQ